MSRAAAELASGGVITGLMRAIRWTAGQFDRRCAAKLRQPRVWDGHCSPARTLRETPPSRNTYALDQPPEFLSTIVISRRAGTYGALRR